MLTIIIGAIALGLAIFTVRYIFHTMANSSCALCLEASEEQTLVVPFLPGVRFWCLNCGNVFTAKQIARRQADGSWTAAEKPPSAHIDDDDDASPADDGFVSLDDDAPSLR